MEFDYHDEKGLMFSNICQIYLSSFNYLKNFEKNLSEINPFCYAIFIEDLINAIKKSVKKNNRFREKMIDRLLFQ